ncbi:MAG: CsbD family protein [Phycisphaerales bacterium]
MSFQISDATIQRHRGKIRERWGKLTDDDMARVEGSGQNLIGAIRERYDLATDEAVKQVADFFNDIADKIAPGDGDKD